MAFNDKSGDLLVTNKLKINIQVITNAQAWAEQVKGTYHLLYPHIVDDFSHFKDIQAWINDIFAKHKHQGVHGPTQMPLPPENLSQISDEKGKNLNEPNSVLGSVRKGMSDLAQLVAGINKINIEKIK